MAYLLQEGASCLESLEQHDQKGNQKQGDIVILWTCRDGKRLTEALNILAKSGFKPNLVNQNAPQAIQALGYDPRKILADIYIDDKAISIK